MNLNDPRITAYALDELDGAEQAEMTRQLEQEASVSGEVEAIRELGRRLRRELQAEAAPGLTEEQREEVFAAALQRHQETAGAAFSILPPADEARPAVRPWKLWIPAAIAAAAAVIVTLGGGWHDSHTSRADHRFGRAEALRSAPTTRIALGDAALAKRVGGREPDPRNLEFGVKLADNARDQPPTAALELPTRGEAPQAQRSLEEPAELSRSAGEQGLLAQAMDRAGVSRTREALERQAEQAQRERPRAGDELGLREKSAQLKDKIAPETAEDRGRNSLLAQLTPSSRMNHGVAPKSAPAAAAAGPAAMPGAPTVQASPPEFDSEPAGNERGAPGQEVPGLVAGVSRKDSVDLRLSSANTWPLLKPGQEKPAAYYSGRLARAERKDATASPSKLAGAAFRPSVSALENPFVNAQEAARADVPVTAPETSLASLASLEERRPRPPLAIEDLVNSIHYHYASPAEGDAVRAAVEVASCPWMPEHRLVRIGLRARKVPRGEPAPANVLLLVDAFRRDGGGPRTAPLVTQALRQVVEELGPRDIVSIAENSGAGRTLLPPTTDKAKAEEALKQVAPGADGTNEQEALGRAYEAAHQRFLQNGANRVIVATQPATAAPAKNGADANDAKKADAGVALAVIDSSSASETRRDGRDAGATETLSAAFYYLDAQSEGDVSRKKIAEGLAVAAVDVRAEAVFDPAQVVAYRLIGYEPREGFPADLQVAVQDGGRLGTDQTSTALYEIIPRQPMTAALGEQVPSAAAAAVERAPVTAGAAGRELAAAKSKLREKQLLTLELQWRRPGGGELRRQAVPIDETDRSWQQSSADFRWAAAAAAAGLVLRDSAYKGSASWELVEQVIPEKSAPDADASEVQFRHFLQEAKGK